MRAHGTELILVNKDQGMEGARDLALEMATRGVVTASCSINSIILNFRAGSAVILTPITALTGPEIWRQMQGHINHFVSSMGTTSTITCVSRFL